MRRQPNLSINGLVLPLPVAGEIQQSYEHIGGYSTMRLGLGEMVHQEVWRKVRTSISAAGAVPPGLAAVDWAAPITLGCVAALNLQSAGNVITIPGARRADAPPYGWAITSAVALAPILVPTPVAMAGSIATLTPVAGAVGYQVAWYPVLSVRAPAGPAIRYDALGAAASWDLVCEEI